MNIIIIAVQYTKFSLAKRTSFTLTIAIKANNLLDQIMTMHSFSNIVLCSVYYLIMFNFVYMS